MIPKVANYDKFLIFKSICSSQKYSAPATLYSLDARAMPCGMRHVSLTSSLCVASRKNSTLEPMEYCILRLPLASLVAWQLAALADSQLSVLVSVFPAYGLRRAHRTWSKMTLLFLKDFVSHSPLSYCACHEQQNNKNE